MKKNMMISLITGILISAVALYFAFRNVPFQALVAYFAGIDYLWVFASVLVVVLNFFGRALRWKYILKGSHTISFWQAYHPMMTGFMLNCILPARVGELARPAILQQKNRVPFATGLATVAAERAFDLFLLIVMLTIVLSYVEIDPSIEEHFGSYVLNKETLDHIANGMVKVCILLIVGIILVSSDAIRNIMQKVILTIPKAASVGGPKVKKVVERYLCYPLIRILDNIAAGFRLVKDPTTLVICLVLSTAIWFSAAVSYYLLVLGCPGLKLSFFEITTVMIIICFIIALPSVPGFWGLWEAGGVFAMSLFAVTAEEAAGFSLASHAVQMFPVIIMGLVSAIVYGVNIKKINYNEETS